MEIVNNVQPLTIFEKKLHQKCFGCAFRIKKKSLDPDFIYLNFQSPKIKYEKPNGLSHNFFWWETIVTLKSATEISKKRFDLNISFTLDLSTNCIQTSPSYFPPKALIIAEIDVFLDLFSLRRFLVKILKEMCKIRRKTIVAMCGVWRFRPKIRKIFRNTSVAVSYFN